MLNGIKQAWASWERTNRIATKVKEQKASEWSTILAALPTEIKAFFSSQESVYESLKSEFVATYTAPVPETTRGAFYVGHSSPYRCYSTNLAFIY